MKRIVLLFGIMIFTASGCFASNCGYNCVKPYDLSNGFSRFMSHATGSNLLAEQVAKVLLKKEVAKNIDGKLKVKVDSYSVKDLKKGIFKSISIQGDNLDLEGVKFTSLDIHTVCDFNYISMKDKNNPVFKEALPMEFNAVLSEDDINQTMMTGEYKNVIDSLNMLAGSAGLFKISSSQVKIKNNKLYYILKVAIPFVRSTQNIMLTSDLKVVKGQIDFTNTKLVNDVVSVDLKKIDKALNYLNPLDFSLNILENKDAKLAVKDVKIMDNKIHANGLIVIPKD